MAAPDARLRKQLSALGLLTPIRHCFDKVPEHRHARNAIALPDALMSGLAVFGLKYPSLLKFDEAYNEGVIRHNLQTLYGVERAPCDTPLRRTNQSHPNLRVNFLGIGKSTAINNASLAGSPIVN
jgi:hypothetical protein